MPPLFLKGLAIKAHTKKNICTLCSVESFERSFATTNIFRRRVQNLCLSQTVQSIQHAPLKSFALCGQWLCQCIEVMCDGSNDSICSVDKLKTKKFPSIPPHFFHCFCRSFCSSSKEIKVGFSSCQEVTQ